MSVIIRLQNLPWSANALDIRQYFRGLSIPEGGVHIVGGELGDAFIAFSTDEDARQAFQLNNGTIKEVQIKLLLSSRTEMQKVIETARKMQTPFAAAVPQPAVIPPVIQIRDEPKRDENRDSNSKDDKNRDRRGRRRSRSRSRSRERNRSRDRRDRRRRDRSRSRDRRDRRRDRRSKSRERLHSRERDIRKSRERKRESHSQDNKDSKSPSPQTNKSIEIIEPSSMKSTKSWDRDVPQRLAMGMNQNANQNQAGILGNYPGSVNPTLEEARRSLGLVTGLQNMMSGQPNLMNMQNDLNGGFPRNDLMKRDSWPQQNKSRFQDRNPLIGDKPPMGNIFPPNQNRPMLGQNNFGGNRSMQVYQNNMNLRMPFNQDMNNSGNRPFMNRPGTMLSDLMSQSQNMRQEFPYNRKDMNDIKGDLLRKPDFPNRMNELHPNSSETCVQLRTYYGGYGDVRRFFNGLYISSSGIKFATDSTGKKNGTIYVKFVKPSARPQALRKSGNQLRGVVVEVAPLSNEEFENCGKQEESDDDKEEKDKNESFPKKPPFICLVVEEIPSFTKEHDILKMFSDYSLLGIHIVTKNRRRMAYVQFNKEEDAEQALGEKNKHFLGGKNLNVRLSNEDEFAEVNGELIETVNISDEPIEIEDDQSNDYTDDNAASFDTDVVLLTGMPYKTTERDVIDFFSDIGLAPTQIHMLLNKYNSPTGDCYCEFSNPDEAIAALDKNGTPLGSGVVTVEPFPRWEMERNLGINPHSGNHMSNNRFMSRSGPRQGPGPLMGPGSSHGPGPGHGPGHGHVPGHGPGPSPRPLMPLNNMMRHQPMSSRFDVPVENMGPPGCVVAMENVPFKAGVEEILHFFQNFNVAAHNVLRRFNENGTPSGDARVTFNSPQEAHRAFDECRFKKIRDRTIFLRVI